MLKSKFAVKKSQLSTASQLLTVLIKKLIKYNYVTLNGNVNNLQIDDVKVKKKIDFGVMFFWVKKMPVALKPLLMVWQTCSYVNIYKEKSWCRSTVGSFYKDTYSVYNYKWTKVPNLERHWL